MSDVAPAPGPDERGWIRRRLDALAFALDNSVAAECSGRPPGPPRGLWIRPALLATSVVVALIVAASLLVGVVLLLTAAAGWKVLGVVLVLLAVELRPRLPRLGVSLGRTRRADQPALFAIVDAVCAELGAPRIDTIVLDESFQASCARYGLRRRPVLTLGLPLWAALTPPARIGLLAHHIGHLVNRNPADGLAAQPLLTTLERLADVFEPHDLVHVHDSRDYPQYADAIAARGPLSLPLFEWIADIFSALVFTPLRLLFGGLHQVVRAATAHSRRHAEYYADALAYRLAGSAGMTEYCETLLLAEPVSTQAHRWLRVGAGAEWVQGEAAEARERNRPELHRLELLSMYADSSLFSDHPPVGVRLQVVRSWPDEAGRLNTAELDFAEADGQLQTAYRRVERALSHLP